MAMSIILPDPLAWQNYADQSETIDGELFWYGVPHPSDVPGEDGPETPTPEVGHPSAAPSETIEEGSSAGLIAATATGFTLFSASTAASVFLWWKLKGAKSPVGNLPPNDADPP
jgi:hypothetical protein